MNQNKLDKLKLEFCKWIEAQPIVECSNPPDDLDEFIYFKIKEGIHHRVKISDIPKKFQPLTSGENGEL